MNPDPTVEATLQALVCGWCERVRDVCTCAPQPLPEPRPSVTVRKIQRGQAAERSSAVAEGGVWPDTRGTPSDPVSEAVGPISGLFPSAWGAAS